MVVRKPDVIGVDVFLASFHTYKGIIERFFAFPVKMITGSGIVLTFRSKADTEGISGYSVFVYSQQISILRFCKVIYSA